MVDVVIVGAGPNGLACAIELADSGLEVLLYERAASIGGGLRSSSDLFAGCIVDQCASIMAMAGISPFFLKHDFFAKDGAEWITPDSVVAHPLADGAFVAQWRDYRQTAAAMGPRESGQYERVMGSLLAGPEYLGTLALGNIRTLFRPSAAALKFALQGILPATAWTRLFTSGPNFAALFSGHAVHAVLPLQRSPSSGIGLALMLAGHLAGWPIVRGGSQRLAEAMGRALTRKSGRIITGADIRSVEELPKARSYVFDLPPRNICRLAEGRLSKGRAERLRSFRHGFGTWKLDFLTRGSIPWKNPALKKFATLHLGGPAGQVVASEQAVADGRVSDCPFLILTQPCEVDPSRGSDGRQPGWAYCHVPNGFQGNPTDKIIRTIEQYAPDFRSVLIDHRSTGPADFEARNPNYIGGDVVGGEASLIQIIGRPLFKWDPYRLENNLFICSASSAPGGGVHGMAGFHAANSVKRYLSKTRSHR